MEVLIIEDEKLAAEHLQRLVETVVPGVKVLKIIDLVKKSIAWITANPHIDLIFMDIQLADGICFEIFEKISILSPVIFTTAYDDYAIKAFKVNSLDYLLKPIDTDDLKKAFLKYKQIYQTGFKPNSEYQVGVEKMLKALTHKYKERFIIKVGEHIRTITTVDVDFFYSLEKASFLQTTAGKTFDVNYTLDTLEELLDPDTFIRVNRKYIVSFPSIRDIISYSNSRLKLILRNCSDDEVIVSRERVNDFKSWLDK